MTFLFGIDLKGISTTFNSGMSDHASNHELLPANSTQRREEKVKLSLFSSIPVLHSK